MRRLFLALAFLTLCSESLAQEQVYAVGSICSPSTPATDDTPAHDAQCVVWELPTNLKLKPHSNEMVPFLVKTNRLVPARPVTAEAAPK